MHSKSYADQLTTNLISVCATSHLRDDIDPMGYIDHLVNRDKIRK